MQVLLRLTVRVLSVRTRKEQIIGLKVYIQEEIDTQLVLLLLLLFIVTPIVGVCNCSMFCCMLLYVHSSFAIILMGKRELVVLLSLSSWCLVIVVWLFLAVPWVCLQFVIVVFPDHTRLLFLIDIPSDKYLTPSTTRTKSTHSKK